jgi:4-cresol dehydrogenase (hydroxylating)
MRMFENAAPPWRTYVRCSCDRSKYHSLRVVGAQGLGPLNRSPARRSVLHSGLPRRGGWARPGYRHLRGFLQRCEERLGGEFVDRGPESLDAASRATYATTQRAIAILRPGSAEEVGDGLRLATEYRVAVYPISGGRNWGLGSRVPPSDAVLLELSRLNRIVDFDEELAYLVVEPGVTFRQAYEFLAARTFRVYLAGIGGPADASVLGNCVERGDGGGMTGERLSNLCGLEIVLPNGQRVELGFSGMGRTPLAPLSRNAAGPQLDGLFTPVQPRRRDPCLHLAVARPAFPQLITCRIGSRDALPGFVERLRGLMLNGLIPPSSFSIWNSWKVAVRTGDRAAAPGDEWHGSGSLHGCSPEHGAAIATLVRDALAPASAQLAIWAPEESERFPGIFGEPVEDNVRSVYWAKPGGAPGESTPTAMAAAWSGFVQRWRSRAPM